MNVDEFEKWLAEKRDVLRKLNKRFAESDRDNPEHAKALDEAHIILNDICCAYLLATAYQRVAIRDIFDRKEHVLSLLLYYPSFVARFIKSPADVEWLKIGLAAALIENLSFDFRDTWVALSDLYVAAEDAGIDPVTYYQSLGAPTEIGDPTPSNGMFRFIGGRSPSQEILNSFLKSEQLKTVKRSK